MYCTYVAYIRPGLKKMLMNRIRFLLVLWSAVGVLACESASERTALSSDATQTVGQNAGMTVFRQNCVLCHGANGQLGLNGAKDLSKSEYSLEERIQIIAHGKNLMAPYRTILSAEEIAAVAAYTLTLKKG